MIRRGVSVADVLTVAYHDLFRTKDVQNPITASYVWLADQIGHISLGLIPTLATAWTWQGIEAVRPLSPAVHWIGLAGIGAAWFALWCWKEVADFNATHSQAGKRFPFDATDLWINVYNALFYIGTGIVFAIAAFTQWMALVALVAIWVPTGFSIAVWWLRRKIAFQQADLPYLFRLADFSGQVASIDMIAAVTALTDPAATPAFRHAIVRGPIDAGKTALVAGIGTEYAFSLGRGRYLTLMKLLQFLNAAKPDPTGAETEVEDGRTLWTWDTADLLIVDDLDAGLPDTTLITPDMFRCALTDLLGDVRPLGFLAERRSVWVLGLAADTLAWRGVLADLIGVEPEQIADVLLTLPAV